MDEAKRIDLWVAQPHNKILIISVVCVEMPFYLCLCLCLGLGWFVVWINMHTNL
jgi:hypothetical protein